LRITVKLKELCVKFIRYCGWQPSSALVVVRKYPILTLLEPAANRGLALMSERRIAEIVSQTDCGKHRLDYLIKVRAGDKLGVRRMNARADRPS
jgi:hypothetical protein